MEAWIWFVIVAVVAVVGIGAYFGGRAMEARSERVKAMERDLEERKKELEEYRTEVTRHFDRTGALFATLTGSYRDLYHHLADGCERLAEIPSKKLFPGTQEVLEATGSSENKEAVAQESPEPQVLVSSEEENPAEPEARQDESPQAEETNIEETTPEPAQPTVEPEEPVQETPETERNR